MTISSKTTYTEILRQVWKDDPSLQKTMIERDPKQQKIERMIAKKVDYFNKMGRSRILIIRDDKTLDVRYVYVSPSYERVELDVDDPVSMAIFLMGIKKLYDCETNQAVKFYHKLMKLPYKKSKVTINKLILGLPKNIANLL